ncbi:hypothetical protein G3I44_10955 [Halogeometricum borinquense]|uniref:Uncharacterized protein n=1 Tax=Halogeometricum borinquense TaxID=60847 RepID=A0A6C0UP84_9EURY|nr:hypothetical protein [Halogeometricum borinquense]QIB74758.1 hypothetical protein G3I44_10955 [Halogeometricum borinquense]
MGDSHHAATYPSEDQYQRWQKRAEEMGMSMSEFMEAMIEAGLKKFSASVEPDETNQELRHQRNELKTELDRARDRIQELEDAVYHGERRTIKRYVEANPGATYDDVIQHVIDTVPQRVTTHLDDLEGEELRYEDGGYYPAENGADS